MLVGMRLDYSKIQASILAWRGYLTQHNWQQLIEGVMPKLTGCGPVYELPNYLEREGESFAIADMREVKVAEPHYHPSPCVEIYLALQGHRSLHRNQLRDF